MSKYIEENGVMKYTESPSKEAVAWQGYDKFVGIDDYRNEILSEGTILVKLEPSGSGYFTTLEEYKKMNKDSTQISQGLQLAPYDNKRTKQYEYRPEVSMWKLTKDVEVAVGETLANKDYGNGGIKQIYIAGYDGWEPDNNKASNLLKKRGSENLENNIISKKHYLEIMDRHEQHILKRNYFCYLTQKSNLLDLKNKSDNYEVKVECREKLEKIDEKLNIIKEDLKGSIKSIGNIESKTYDNKTKGLTRKIKSMELNQAYNGKEIGIEKVNNNIMKKVSDEIKLINSGEINIDNRNERINIDELRKADEVDIYVGIEKGKQILTENSRNIKQIDNRISNIYEEKEVLKKAKECFENIDKYEKTAKKYDNKIFFKKSYQKAHREEKSIYDSSKNYLKNKGIENKDKYLEKLKEYREKLLPEAKKDIEKLKQIDAENKSITKKVDKLEKKYSEFKEFENKLKKERSLPKKEKKATRGISR